VNQRAQGENTIQSCGRHIRYYDVTLSGIKKQCILTLGDAVIIGQRVQKWKEESLICHRIGETV